MQKLVMWWDINDDSLFDDGINIRCFTYESSEEAKGFLEYKLQKFIKEYEDFRKYNTKNLPDYILNLSELIINLNEFLLYDSDNRIYKYFMPQILPLEEWFEKWKGNPAK
jgi:hypothetical protein